ncbi:sm [Bugula neritina]|uniref:Sm n=1 Tax=Bugula neritina TaxID=10212 RepID=A0A7J7KPG5_BUGNE|nr:sm [Bugula neritina]
MNLNNSFFFDSKLSVGFSKQDFVKIHPNPSELADGSPSAKEYTTDKNNRFFSPDSINKTRFSPPTKVVHFFNAPPTFSEDDLKEVLKRNSTSDPVRIRIFPIKPGARSAAGLIEYASVADASEVMVQSNHSIIKNPTGKMPFSLKLSFSASPIIDKPGRGGDKRGDPEDK